MCLCRLWELSVFVACFCVFSVTTFNVDSFNYASYDSLDSTSMFGFSIALHKEGNNGWLIVGAPEAQSSYQRNVTRGGVVYKCPTDQDGNCQEIPFDTKDNLIDQQTGHLLDNKTEQWFGATVSSSGRPEGPIVACAPRYHWHPVPDRRDPVGTCYVSNGLFNQFNEYSPCRTYQWGFHRQGSCQAGFSAAINSIGDRLFIGAPGSWYWQGQMYSVDAHAKFEYKPLLFSATYGSAGQVHQQSLETRPAVFSTTEGTLKDDNSYMGYSTITGDFLGNGEEGIAVGMPRGNTLLGKVILFTWNLTDYRQFSGDQLGCYFGYALAASDVDGDGYLDLIVGAPMYTVPNNKDEYDVGRVYVFFHRNGTQKGIFNTKYAIDGFHSKSRFGQALASLGDINQDGYGDFAVGAPYDGKENRGAVYIYHGSSKGVRKTYSQVIFAEDVTQFSGTALSTFGFSLTGGLDLDGNQYPDMAVGAYLSSKAFFFRSRPVIRVDAYVKFLTPNKEIDLEKADLILANNTRAVKTQIIFCSKFYGKGIPASIKLDLQYILDSKKHKLEPRMGFLDSEGSSVKNDTITLKRSETKCTDTPIDVYVRSDIRDKLTPLVAEVKYWMSLDDDLHHDAINSYRNPRSTLIPVLDLNSPPSKKDSIRIQTNCGNDNVCIPNLTLQVTPTTPIYYFNTGAKVELEIFVSNVGEESFETVLIAKYPESLYYGNSIDMKNDTHVLCSDFNYTVQCELGNPLPNNKGVRFKLWWKPNYDYEDLSKGYFFELLVNSTNPEKPDTLENNRQNITIQIRTEYHQQIRQQSVPADVFFNSSQFTADISKQSQNTSQEDRLPEEVIGPQAIHVYRLKNDGEVSIKKSEIFFILPSYTTTGDDFFYLVEPPHFAAPEKMNIQCDAISANYRDFVVISSKNRSIWERFNIEIPYGQPSSAERIHGTTPPPPTVSPGGQIVKNDSQVDIRMAKRRIEIFQTGGVDDDYLAHPISNTQYSYRCLKAESGAETPVDCSADYTDMIQNVISLVRDGQLVVGHQRRCMAVIDGKLKPIKCGTYIKQKSLTRVQIFQSSNGYYQRRQLGNTRYFYSCLEITNGREKEVACGPEMDVTVNYIASLVEQGKIRVGYHRHCVESVNGAWKEVDCDTGKIVGVQSTGSVQIFQGQFGMIGEKHQLNKLGNTNYYYRCLQTDNGREVEVDCGPEFSSTVTNILRLVESGRFQGPENLDGRCLKQVNGEVKITACGPFAVSIGRVQVFQGHNGYVGGKYQNQRFGNTKYFYRCLRIRNGREEEVECGQEFLSTINSMFKHIEEDNTAFFESFELKCMVDSNGKLVETSCDSPEPTTYGRVQIFQVQSGTVSPRYHRIGNTDFYYRCLKNDEEIEIPCGPQFRETIARMTLLIRQGKLDFMGQQTCMIERNGQLIPVQCNNNLVNPVHKRTYKVRVFQGRNGYVGGKYQNQRFGNTNFFYECLEIINNQEVEVSCEQEALLLETIASYRRMIEEGKFDSFHTERSCMIEENGKLTPIPCDSGTSGQYNLPAGNIQIFHADIGGDAYQHQRIANTDYFYRCTQTINGVEEEVSCGPQFHATIQNITRLLRRGGYGHQCMEMVNGKLRSINCGSIFANVQVTTESSRNATYVCWLYMADSWKTVPCDSSDLLLADGKTIFRRCLRNGSPQPQEVNCTEVINLYHHWSQGANRNYERRQQFGGVTYGQGGQQYSTFSNSSYHYGNQGRRDPYTYGTYGRNGNQNTGLEGAALGTGGFHTEFLDVPGNHVYDDYDGRDNVPTQRSTKWHGRRKRQIPIVEHPSVAIIRRRFPCKSMRCEYLRCTVENFEHGKELAIALRGRLNARVLRNISLSEPLSFSTMMATRVIESPIPGSTSEEDFEYQEATTLVKKTEAELKTDIVPLWVVVLSAVAGTIILLLLVFLLYKLGFFKRNRPSSAPERQPLNRNGYHHGDEVL